ncbi:transposase, MuDR, MULE transposase domain protein, partial [Tanacetum coccineum]
TCKAYTVPEFEKSISGIRALRPEAYIKLEVVRFEKWSRAHCPANRYNYMTSNCAESINALTKTVTKVPITMLMDYYRDLIQRWYFERRFKVYQVRDNKRFHLVDLAKRECSCRKWQLSGLPCGHVCALSRCLVMTNCNRWAKVWFSKRTLKGTYQELVYPLADPNLWETPHDLQVVLPPALVKSQPGRPKKKDRIRSQGEDPKINRCSRCDTMGHHRDACHSSMPSQVNASYQNQPMDWSQSLPNHWVYFCKYIS